MYRDNASKWGSKPRLPCAFIETDVDSQEVAGGSGGTLASGEEVMDLELIHYPVTTRMSGEGQRITVTVAKDDVSASLNGRTSSHLSVAPTCAMR